MSKAWTGQDWLGVAIVAASIAGLILYRALYIEPRAWGAICAASSPPVACAPRAALLWLQRYELWGLISLALGLAAFLFRGPRPLAVAAMVIGAAGVENYNATWGMLGLALGAWSWAESKLPPRSGQPGRPG